jgi:hypothetical protein
MYSFVLPIGKSPEGPCASVRAYSFPRFSKNSPMLLRLCVPPARSRMLVGASAAAAAARSRSSAAFFPYCAEPAVERIARSVPVTIRINTFFMTYLDLCVSSSESEIHANANPARRTVVARVPDIFL